MRIYPLGNQQNHKLSFEAKLPLNSRELLKGSALAGEITPLDKVLNESPLVKSINTLSWRLRLQISKHSKDFGPGSVSNALGKAIYLLRVVADRLFISQNSNSLNHINSVFEKIKPDSPEYIEELAKFGKTVDSKFVHINTEDRVLEDVTSTDESVLFVLNHPNFHKDKLSYLVINSLLSQMYTANNMQETCPRPKILVSRNMLKILGQKTGEIYKHLGLVEVDPSLTGLDKSFNIRAMGRILKEFIENKSNLFFFAEGNKSSFLQLPLEDRIQPGVAQFVSKVLAFKPEKRVKVVPVGLHYPDEKNCEGNIHLGTPINFYRENDFVLSDEGGNVNLLNPLKPVEGILEIIKKALVSSAEKSKTQE